MSERAQFDAHLDLPPFVRRDIRSSQEQRVASIPDGGTFDNTSSERRMIYFFRRGDQKLTSETQLNPDGPGYQLVIRENDAVRIESFDALPKLLAREHELLVAWRAQGWSELRNATHTPLDAWPGPR
jgi:hypothetical protein